MYEQIVIHDTREKGRYLQATDSVCNHSVPCDILFLLLRYFRDTLATIFLCKSVINKCEGYTLEIKIREKCYVLQFLHVLAIISLLKSIINDVICRWALFGLNHLIHNFVFFVSRNCYRRTREKS